MVYSAYLVSEFSTTPVLTVPFTLIIDMPDLGLSVLQKKRTFISEILSYINTFIMTLNIPKL